MPKRPRTSSEPKSKKSKKPRRSPTTISRTSGFSNVVYGKELKFVDAATTLNPAAASAAFTAGTLLNGLTIGSGADNRVGRRMKMLSLEMKWLWSLSPTSTGGSPARILVVYDKQSNTVATPIADVLVTDNALSVYNLANQDRFIILADFLTSPISPGSNYGVGGVVRKKLNLETIYNAGNAGTISDISSGAIYIYSAQFASIATAGPDFYAQCRIRFSD